MLMIKKTAGLLTVLCAILCASLAMSACDGGETSAETQAEKNTQTDTVMETLSDTEEETEGAVLVDCAFTVKDQDGIPVAGVTFAIKQAGVKVAEATSDAQGKVSAKVPVGSGVVEFTDLPDQYSADSSKIEFTEATTAMELTVMNTVPNGKADRPFVLTEDRTVMTIAAKGDVYYTFYGGSNRYLLVENTTATITYKEKTYAPDENGMLKVDIVADNTREPVTFAISNPGAADITVTLLIQSKEGSIENPTELTALNTPVTVIVPKEGTVYYKWVSTVDGVLMVSSDHPLNNITLTNQRNSAASYFTDGSACEYIGVKQGDAVLISVGSKSKDSETEISFSISATAGSQADPVVMGKDKIALHYDAGVSLAYSYLLTDAAQQIKVKGAREVVVILGEGTESSYLVDGNGEILIPLSAENQERVIFNVTGASEEGGEVVVEVISATATETDIADGVDTVAETEKDPGAEATT